MLGTSREKNEGRGRGHLLPSLPLRNMRRELVGVVRRGVRIRGHGSGVGRGKKCRSREKEGGVGGEDAEHALQTRPSSVTVPSSSSPGIHSHLDVSKA